MSEVKLSRDDQGSPLVATRLSEEENEILKALYESPAWKLYQGILLKARDAYLNTCITEKDPNEVMKRLGLVAGINFAVVQLGGVYQTYMRKQAKSVERATKNDPGAPR